MGHYKNIPKDFLTGLHVYVLHKGAVVVYVGSTSALSGRLAAHLWEGKDFDRATYRTFSTKDEMFAEERRLILKHRPALNVNTPLAPAIKKVLTPKVKIMISIDENLVEWLDEIKRVAPSKPGRSTTINRILRDRKNRSHKALLAR